ncbi:TraY domain-containing protein [Anaerotruncus sp. AF02-27]|uniref:TraY domain-containing protein n=1 Tax=Anaerotruncus sp. AF02-27 TaxID=2292191 RepID=UPI000E4863BA|nr:TraY domain-containing protein [Anaerotruncus sp. AF02-27]RGX54682.1 TraY domain-containing protein [Anaerotruncus sp. AF02-27]
MPTNKTPFTFNIEDEYLEKMRYIAKRETRSLSNLLEHLCKLYIEKYEQEHTKIELDNTKDSSKG